MRTAMTQMKETAADHMSHVLAAGPRWGSGCEACVGTRALVGPKKALRVRPLVRAIGALEARLAAQPIGPGRLAVAEQYLGLYDELAGVMAG